VILQRYLSDWFDKNIESRGQSRLCRRTVRKGFAFPTKPVVFPARLRLAEFEA
jgi:hypothetical protein